MPGLTNPTSRTITYEGIPAHAAEFYYKQEGVIDNIFSPFVAWKILFNKFKRIQHPGGNRMVYPLTLDADALDPSYSGYGTVNTVIPNMDSVAHVPMAEGFVPIGQSYQERDLVRGDAAVSVDIALKSEQAMNRMLEALNLHFYGDGTGNSSQRYIGMAAWVDPSPTSSTIAGIDSSLVTGWRNQLTTSTDITTLLLDLRDLLSSCRQGSASRGPNVCISNRIFRKALEGRAMLTTTTATYTTLAADVTRDKGGKPGVGSTADFGFGKVAYYGIPIEDDPAYTTSGTTSATEGEALFLATDTFRVVQALAPGKLDVAGFFEMVKPSRPIAQTAEVGGLRYHFQLVCLERRLNGLIEDCGADA